MKSLLTKKAIKEHLGVAMENREKDGDLMPVVFINSGGKITVVGMGGFPPDVDRRKLFAGLGLKFKKEFGEIDEAIFIAETWFVKANKDADITSIPPSQHPDRQEAIILVGRNKKKDKQIMIVQPFIEVKGKTVWDKEKEEGADGAIGILDYLFEPSGDRLGKVAMGVEKAGKYKN